MPNSLVLPACLPAPQVLVFVHSRKETAKTARFIKEMALKEDKLARFMKEDRWGESVVDLDLCLCPVLKRCLA